MWGEYEGLRDEMEREEGGGEEMMKEGRVKRVEGMEFVSDEAMGAEVVYVRSPTGSGKTQAMVKWLGEKEEGEYKNKRCCIVTQRVSLSEDLYNHFEKLGFQHYKRVEDVRKVDRLIIQVESLWKLVGEGKAPLEVFDVLLLDESESLVSQFLSKNIKRVNETRAVVEWLMAYSKKVVCMDAYLSADTVGMVRAFRGEGVDEVFYVNKTKTEVGTRVEVVHYYEELVMRMLHSVIEKKRKVCFATNSIQKSREVYKILTSEKVKETGLKVALYNSDHMKEYWGDLGDVNQNWTKYDVIIYTSSIETGISFTERHFDELFGYFTPQSTNYKSALQMLKRVRDLGEKKMVLYVKPVRMMKGAQFSEEQYDQLWRDTVGDYLDDIPFQMDRRGVKIYKYKGPFYDLAMINFRREVESKSDYFYQIMHHLEKVGCYVYLDDDSRRTVDDIVSRRAVPKYYDGFAKKLLNAVTKMIKAEVVDDIKNADLRKAERDDGKESQDAKTYLAIQRCLDTDKPLTEEQIVRYKDENARRKLYNVKELYGRTAEEYTKMMKSYHLDKVKNNNGHTQPEVVMGKNNSLQCMLAYEMIVLKLWPELREKPFDLELLEKKSLSVGDVGRFRENSDEEVGKLSRLLGVRKARIMKNVKDKKKNPTKKIIYLINIALETCFNLRLKGNYSLCHDYVDIIMFSGMMNFRLD
jgi:hypothetical protein